MDVPKGTEGYGPINETAMDKHCKGTERYGRVQKGTEGYGRVRAN